MLHRDVTVYLWVPSPDLSVRIRSCGRGGPACDGDTLESESSYVVTCHMHDWAYYIILPASTVYISIKYLSSISRILL